MIEALKAEYVQKGVVLTTKRFAYNKVELKCDLGGEPKVKETSDGDQKRKKGSRLIGCTFEIICGCKKGVLYVRKISDDHNHVIPDSLIGHSKYRKLDGESKIKVRSMYESNVEPKEILSSLKKESQSNASIQEVYNAVKGVKRDFLEGRSPLETLSDIIASPEYTSKLRLDDGGRVNGLFLALNEVVKLAKRFDGVFLLDCTYKTNKFGMPLLNFVGIACTNQTFNAAVAFLPDEQEESYKCALREFSSIASPRVIAIDRELSLMNAIAVTFPMCKNVLCIWHINKNVGSKCKGFFKKEDEWKIFLQR